MSGSGNQTQGLEVRNLAGVVLKTVLEGRHTVEGTLEDIPAVAGLAARDRAFLLTLVLTTLRHRGEIETVLGAHLTKPLPRKSGVAALVLWLGVAQLLFLGVPAHAAIDLAVRSARADRDATHFSGLINAVLRKIARRGEDCLSGLDGARLNTPDWLWRRWTENFGAETARRIAEAHGIEPATDIVVLANAELWAEKLGGVVLPTGQIRLARGSGSVSDLPGFDEGAWWVQDAAATLPVRFLGDLRGKSALDLCAAPGGKTLQLCAAGAKVTAVDNSGARLKRLHDNLGRMRFRAELVTEDVLSLSTTEMFDAVLLDAPCSATGTIRRHPELPWSKAESQVGELAILQRKMLLSAALRVRPGGRLLYCTCSLEPEEGEKQISRFLSSQPDFGLVPIQAGDFGLDSCFIGREGWLRSLPFMSLGDSKGVDGFFAAVLRRKA